MQNRFLSGETHYFNAIKDDCGALNESIAYVYSMLTDVP